jgi:hypothetical protein
LSGNDRDGSFVRIPATTRQACQQLRPCYRTLTRLFKLIATPPWQGLRQPGGNSPAGVSGRQMEAGRPTAGSSRAGAQRASTTAYPWRLDPFSLPARFATADEAADEGVRIVDLHRERVVLRRALSGMRMAVNLPVAAYRGIAIRLDATIQTPPMVCVTLEHADASLSLPLFASTNNDDIVAEWQIWGRVLGLPLLIADTDGTIQEAFARIGQLRIAAPTWRRRRRSAIARRRSSRLLRRRVGRADGAILVHRGEREIVTWE